jgi:hypothetical protein
VPPLLHVPPFPHHLLQQVRACSTCWLALCTARWCVPTQLEWRAATLAEGWKNLYAAKAKVRMAQATHDSIPLPARAHAQSPHTHHPCTVLQVHRVSAPWTKPCELELADPLSEAWL